MDHRQTETYSLAEVLGRKEWLPGMREGVLIHLHAAVLYRSTDIVARL